MQLSTTLLLALAGQTALASPMGELPVASASAAVVPSSEVSPNAGHEVLATLEDRDYCTLINRVVKTCGTSWFLVAFTNAGLNYAASVCAGEDDARCAQIIGYIRDGLNLVYLAVGMYKSGAVPESPDTGLPVRRWADNAAVHAAYRQSWVDALNATSGGGGGGGGGFMAYDSIETVPFDLVETSRTKKRADDPDLVTRVRIAGVRDESTFAQASNTSHTAETHDVMFNHFADGTTVLHLPIASRKNSNGTLGKRATAPGFKISYTHRLLSELSKPHKWNMADAGATEWAYQADNNYIKDMIGFAATGKHANFYYRIIPETRSFGTNYESVNVCGEMLPYIENGMPL